MKKLNFLWSKKEALKMLLGVVLISVGILIFRECYIQSTNKKKHDEISLENFKGKAFSSYEVIKTDYPIVIRKDDEFENSMKNRKSILFYNYDAGSQIIIVRPDTIPGIYIQSEKLYGKTDMFYKYNSMLENKKIVIYKKTGDGVVFILIIIGAVIFFVGIFTTTNHFPIFSWKPK